MGGTVSRTLGDKTEEVSSSPSDSESTGSALIDFGKIHVEISKLIDFLLHSVTIRPELGIVLLFQPGFFDLIVKKLWPVLCQFLKMTKIV